MALLSVSNVSKSYGATKIFENVSFTIENNHRIGLVGINGSGKTTLLKVICDQEPYDTGEVYTSKQLKIGYVEQFVCRDSKRTALEELIHVQQELLQLEEKMETLQQQMEEVQELKTGQAEEDRVKRLEKIAMQKHACEMEYQEKGGYTYRSIARSTLLGLGFQEQELQLTVEELSGGQRTKLTLAKLLFSDCNLLLLDEPTNYLDIASLEWLENFLLNFKGSYLVISHDRYFLDKVTKETFEMESGRLTIYRGNYTKYLELKAERKKTMTRNYENTQKEIRRLEQVIEQQKTWSQEHNYKTIRNKQKGIERLENSLEKPDKEMEKMKFHFKTISGGNQEVLVTQNLGKSFSNKTLFQKVSIRIWKGEHAFLVGPNGCGKTTFLRIILQQLPADSGEFQLGNHMKVAYYSQAMEELVENKTILEYVWDAYPKLKQTEVRQALAVFLFKGEEVNQMIRTLSGGERARVALLMIMLSEANFLILDEPTNHLDILSREALETALQEYDGTMLIVSHDRYFMNKLATKIYRFTEQGAKEYEGNYDQYLEKEKAEQAGASAGTGDSMANAGAKFATQIRGASMASENGGQEEGLDNSKAMRKMLYQEKKANEAAERKRKKRIAFLEEEMQKNDAQVKELEEMAKSEEYATDYVKVMELMEQVESRKKENETLLEEWMQLSEEDASGVEE